ncbi:MAG: hypothetical protein ACOCUI_02740 [bacterium]
MEYECQVKPVRSLEKGIANLKKPLCTRCSNTSCTNPIIEKKISIFGINYTTKLLQSADRMFFVISCEGFQMEEKEEKEEKDEI